MTLVEMKEQRIALLNKLTALQANDPNGEMTAVLDQAEALDASINVAERAEALQARMAAPAPSPIRRVAPTSAVPASAQRKPGTFANVGEFAIAARNTGMGRVDPRLTNDYAGQSEGTPADGGYLVPDDHRREILSPITEGMTSYLALCDIYPTSSKKLVLPVDRDTPWGTTGLPVAVAEAGDIAVQKLAVADLEIDVKKEAVAFQYSDELAEDAPSFSAWLNKKIPTKFVARLNKLILQGAANGTETMKGILTSAAVKVITKETSQADGSLLLANVQKMFAAFPQSATVSPSARWLIHPAHKVSVMGLKDENDNAVYLPNGNVAGRPFETLYGIAIEWCQFTPAVGAQADVALVDFKAMVIAVRSGVKTDTDLSLGFLTGTQYVKATMRVGGAPALAGPIVCADGATELSPFVVLGARVTA